MLNSVIVFAVASAVAGALAHAQYDEMPTGNCMEDNWFHDENIGILVCRAKEVRLENVAAAERGTCKEGETVTVDLNASVVVNTARYDIGWYISLDGGDALNGKCSIQPLLQADYPLGLNLVDRSGSDSVVGEVTWADDLNGGNDECGDLKFHSGGIGVLDSVSIGKDLTMPCIDKNGDGTMDFAICFSWRQDDDDVCNPDRLYPSHPSKCMCTRYEIPQISVVSRVDEDIC